MPELSTVKASFFLPSPSHLCSAALCWGFLQVKWGNTAVVQTCETEGTGLAMPKRSTLLGSHAPSFPGHPSKASWHTRGARTCPDTAACHPPEKQQDKAVLCGTGIASSSRLPAAGSSHQPRLPQGHAAVLPPAEGSATPAGPCAFCRQIKTFSSISVFCLFFLRNWWLTPLCHGVSLVPRKWIAGQRVGGLAKGQCTCCLCCRPVT